jgi:hypothetical protein
LSISANSPAIGLAGLFLGSEFFRANQRRDLVEHAIDVLVAIGAAKGLGQLDGFVDDDAVGRFRVVDQLEGCPSSECRLRRREFAERAVDVLADLLRQFFLLLR